MVFDILAGRGVGWGSYSAFVNPTIHVQWRIMHAHLLDIERNECRT